MSFRALSVRNKMMCIAPLHTRESRTSVQIAEARQTGYIPRELRKSGYTMMAGRDLQAFLNMRSILRQKEEFSPKQRQTGRISREWQKKDNEELC